MGEKKTMGKAEKTYSHSMNSDDAVPLFVYLWITPFSKPAAQFTTFVIYGADKRAVEGMLEKLRLRAIRWKNRLRWRRMQRGV